MGLPVNNINGYGWLSIVTAINHFENSYPPFSKERLFSYNSTNDFCFLTIAFLIITQNF